MYILELHFYNTVKYISLQKATKKTDKSRLEQDDIDIAELSNEELKEQLLRYGVNPGPIVGKLIQ